MTINGEILDNLRGKRIQKTFKSGQYGGSTLLFTCSTHGYMTLKWRRMGCLYTEAPPKDVCAAFKLYLENETFHHLTPLEFVSKIFE